MYDLCVVASVVATDLDRARPCVGDVRGTRAHGVFFITIRYERTYDTPRFRNERPMTTTTTRDGVGPTVATRRRVPIDSTTTTTTARETRGRAREPVS